MADVAKSQAHKLPTPEEIDAMHVFPEGNPECTVLCDDLQMTVDELQGASGAYRRQLVARLRAIRAQMQHMGCHLCLPQ